MLQSLLTSHFPLLLPMLTSLTNDLVKLVRALQTQRKAREKEGRFVVEGVRLLEEAARAGAQIDFAFYTADADERAQAALLAARKGGATLIEVSPPVMRHCSDTEHPQAVLAVVAFAPAALPPSPPPVGEAGVMEGITLICDRLTDPGNLGTLLRAAAAVGVAAALLAPGTVDAYNPKVVRGGMGAHFRLQIESLDWNQVVEKTHGLCIRLADSHSARFARIPNSAFRYDLADWTLPSAIIIGSEADGPSPEARAAASEVVFIPMPGLSESLNAAMAGSIILFEALRQRTAAGDQRSTVEPPIR
ncbi:MAG: RNA methyltransferase [Chloroflexi bacterium]|nr:RNA methyltransferase [Chloroflexota bacterium]MBI5828480.1 RNA methyltransferase [Chloroflexota bacterium]